MKPEKLQPLPGMNDLQFPEILHWQHVEEVARNVFGRFGLREVRTPLLERAELFERSIGDTTDVVQKEMYVFEDRGGRRVALRPEGTAGVLRNLAGRGPEGRAERVYYMGPMFRSERPQAGRRRQFHQIGVEILGPAEPLVDAECIVLQVLLLEAFGLKKIGLRLNTRGSEKDLPRLRRSLRDLLEPRQARLCEDCRRRLQSNVLRILDCKQETCQAVVRELPPLDEFMSQESRDYFNRLERALDEIGISYEREPRLIRGLDYYLHTIWEIFHPALGAQDAISGGGRYRVDLGGESIEGIGFALGMERVIEALQAEGAGALSAATDGPQVWLVSIGRDAALANLALATDLRRKGLHCGGEFQSRSAKAQMRAAGRSGAELVIVRGSAEIERGTVVLKDMKTGNEDAVPLTEIVETVLGRVNREAGHDTAGTSR